MANDNETVEQACESICELVIAIHDKEHNGKQEIKNVWHIVQQVKDRIIDAHNREMAEAKRISDAVVQSLRDDKLEMAGEIMAKDAEIERLTNIKKEYINLQAHVAALRREVTLKQNQNIEQGHQHRSEVKSLRALVGELADALEKTCVPDSCRNCETEYKVCTSECPNRMRRALVARAREMFGGVK